MPRAARILAAVGRRNRPVMDTVILDHAQRSAQKTTVTGIKGGACELSCRHDHDHAHGYHHGHLHDL